MYWGIKMTYNMANQSRLHVGVDASDAERTALHVVRKYTVNSNF